MQKRGRLTAISPLHIQHICWASVTENWCDIRFSPKLDSGMILSLVNYRPFCSSACGEMFICLKLGQNLLEIEVGKFVRIQKVIWDQLLASNVEKLSRGKLYFHFCSEWLSCAILLYFLFRSLL